jgi:hypothetical protein
MKSENKLVKEALSFLGWGMLTGSTKAAFEKCETVDEMLIMVPACTRKYMRLMMDKADIEKTPEMELFVCLGFLADADFSCCARKFEGDLARKLVQLEGLVYGD